MLTKEQNVYQTTLDADTLEKARLELREDNSTREQSLELFRHWVEKHPAIKSCRTDAQFLLRFLRTKKFNLPMAQEMLEHYLMSRELRPEWFQKLDFEDSDLMDIIDSGYVLPLPKRDQHGRVMILTSTGRFDPHKFSSLHLARIHSLISEALIDDEENTIHGFVFIFNLSGMTMRHLSAWSLMDVRLLIKCVQSGSPMRTKEIHFVNIPSAVVKFIEITLMMFNNKFKSRTKVHKDIQSLKEMIDAKLLPKEYGGEVPLSEMIAEFKKSMKEKRNRLLELDDMHIEISKDFQTDNDEFGGICGSFRKLEVD